jgi:hypothetical protein
VFGLFFRIFLSILLLGFEILLLARNLGCGSFGAYCFEILARVCVCVWWVQLFWKFDWEWWFQVRRGADRAEIYSLAFSATAQWLAVSSDKGTVHVFNLKVDSGLLGHDRSHTTSESSPTSPTAALPLSFIRGLCICTLSYLGFCLVIVTIEQPEKLLLLL